jgi:glycosyltransferase involved in cell wall biosynthesis
MPGSAAAIEPRMLRWYERAVRTSGSGLLRARRPAADPDALVSVCVPVKNGVRTIARALASVSAQSYQVIECVVVDGASTDGTTDALISHNRVDVLFSAQDRNAEEAINRAIALASGRYICLLAADDWLSPDHIARCLATLLAGEADLVMPSLAVSRGAAVRYHRVRPLHAPPAYDYPVISGLGWLAKRSLFERTGLFDTSIPVASDLDLLFRLLARGARVAYEPDVYYHFAEGGHSGRHRLRSHLDVRRVVIANGGSRARATAHCLRSVGIECVRAGLARTLPSRWYERLLRRLHAERSQSIEGEHR